MCPCVCVKHKGKFRPDSSVPHILCTFFWSTSKSASTLSHFIQINIHLLILPRWSNLFGSRMRSKRRDSLSEHEFDSKERILKKSGELWFWKDRNFTYSFSWIIGEDVNNTIWYFFSLLLYLTKRVGGSEECSNSKDTDSAKSHPSWTRVWSK